MLHTYLVPPVSQETFSTNHSYDTFLIHPGHPNGMANSEDL